MVSEGSLPTCAQAGVVYQDERIAQGINPDTCSQRTVFQQKRYLQVEIGGTNSKMVKWKLGGGLVEP